MSELGEVLNAAIGKAIEDAFSENEHGFVLKWIALVETVAPDGDRGMWTATSQDVSGWDTLGMLTYQVAREQAAILHPDEGAD